MKVTVSFTEKQLALIDAARGKRSREDFIAGAARGAAALAAARAETGRGLGMRRTGKDQVEPISKAPKKDTGR